MAGSQGGQAIPTQLGRVQFEQFVLPHLSVGSRGPAPKLSLFKIFNHILRQLHINLLELLEADESAARHLPGDRQ